MSVKSTHEGTCQACGRQQALPGGVLSKHGYTVDWGYFHGVCHGAGHEPLEVSRTLCDRICVELTERAAECDADVKRIFAGTLTPVWAHADFYCKDRQGKTTQVLIPFADATPYNRAQATQSLRYDRESEARHCRAHVNTLQALASKVHGKALQARVEEQKKQVAVGSRIKVYGRTGTVTEIRNEVCSGCGPFLNGQYLPHAVIRWDGNDGTGRVPVRSIRTIL